MTTTVTTQSAFDSALAAGELDIIVNSPRGVRIDVPSYSSATVSAYGSANVSAYGSANVNASDSATVRAYESATVRASGSATVRASGSSTVYAFDSANVNASDSATVSAYDSATVNAYGSANVNASDSATVSAYDSATVNASDSATVRAFDSANVIAGKYVPVHLYSKLVTVDGGVPIDVSDIDLYDRASWIDFHGVEVRDGQAVVYKAVDAGLNAGHGYTITNYPIGGTVTAHDWNPSNDCGYGLHFGYTPHIAAGYFNGSGEPRFLECLIDMATFVALEGKCKAQTATVVREVTITGEAI